MIHDRRGRSSVKGRLRKTGTETGHGIESQVTENGPDHRVRERPEGRKSEW